MLEEISCGEPFLRCCVPNSSSYGTTIETSPPFNVSELNSTSLYNSSFNSASLGLSSITESFSPLLQPTTLKNVINNSTLISSTVNSTSNQSSSTLVVVTLNTTSVPSNPSLYSEVIHPKCPGICVKVKYTRYCSNIMSNGVCEHTDEECCLQSEKNSLNVSFSSPLQSTSLNDKISITLSPVLTKNSTNHTNDILDKKDTALNSIATDANLCDGTCVSQLFSLLCDEIDTNKSCSNGGTCCIDHQPTITTTPNSMPECLGTCIPTFLSGVCARPSELILKTLNCMPGTICCYFLDFHPASERPNISPSLPPPPPPILHLLNKPKPSPSNIQYFSKPNGPIDLSSASSLDNFSSNFPNVNLNRKPVHLYSLPSPPLTLLVQNSSSSVNSQSFSDASKPHPLQKNPLFLSETPENMLSGGPPYCSGPCIAPIFRFTCFGGNAIYPKFLCAKIGHVCCAPLSDIEAFEANLIANNGVWKTPIINELPTEESSTSNSEVTVAPIKRNYYYYFFFF